MSHRPRVTTIAFLTGVVLVFAVATRRVTPSAARSVETYHNDNARTGQNLKETLLTPRSVNVSTFGKVGFFPVDGKVDAQPLYVSGVVIPGQGPRDVLYAVTEHDSVYAFDASTGAVLWLASMLGPGETPSDARNCSQVTPEIGITSTPVIDSTRGPSGAIYVVAMSRTDSTYFHRLHALDLATGTELFGGPTIVQASVPNSGGSVSFDPKQYEERAALLLLNGQIITAWTSHCDIDPYNGWIMAYNASTLAQTSVLNVTPNGSRGGFWMAGAGPAADAMGNVYLLDGNGTFDTTLDGNGFPNQGDFGNAFLKLSTSSGLAVADYFATFDTVQKSDDDSDLGSGGTLVLPDLIDGTGHVRHLAVGAGKDAHIYIVDRDSMGKWNSSVNQIYQDITGALGGGVVSMPAYFNNTLYYGASGDAIKAFPLVNALLASSPSSATAQTFGYPGATPSISANGNRNAIVWAVENASPAVLHAYDALDLSRELYNSGQAAGGRDGFGPGNKFITPTVVSGHVYVGTTDGVADFGLFTAAHQVPGDFDGDGKADITVFRPSNGTWYTRYSKTLTAAALALGGVTDIPVPGDYDGDGKADIAVFRPSNGTWYIRYSGTLTGAALAWGGGADIPVPGDYDGDGITDIAVFRPSNGTWYIRYSATLTSAAFAWGGGNDVPVPRDYDGDGFTDMAVFRPADGTWYIRYSATLTSAALVWGGVGDIPAPGDYDGDGLTDIAVFRPSNGTWYVRYSATLTGAALAWGGGSDIPVPGDYDGDGLTDIAVFRPSTGTWYIRYSATLTSAAFSWGGGNDIPILKP